MYAIYLGNKRMCCGDWAKFQLLVNYPLMFSNINLMKQSQNSPMLVCAEYCFQRCSFCSERRLRNKELLQHFIQSSIQQHFVHTPLGCKLVQIVMQESMFSLMQLKMHIFTDCNYKLLLFLYFSNHQLLSSQAIQMTWNSDGGQEVKSSHGRYEEAHYLTVLA